jgi:catalase
LANVDTDLCEQVVAGLGLAAPKGKPAEDVIISPRLVQILAEPGPIEGRKIGVIADAGSDLAGVSKLVKSAAGLGVTALVIAPSGGVLKAGRRSVTVDRTLLTARSIEFDALVVAGGTTASTDIKLVVLLQKAFRHCKVLAAWADGVAILHAAGITPADPGIEIAGTVDTAFTTALAAGLGLYRAWDRVAVVASAMAPAG